MRKQGERHSKGNRKRRNFLFAAIFMMILFSFCGCGKTTDTISSGLEEELSEKEEIEEEDFSENIPAYSEDDKQEKDSMADAGQTKEELAASDNQAKEDLTASDSQIKEDSEADSQVKEDSTASGSQEKENPAAADNQTKEDSVATESQTNNTTVASESVELSRESGEELVEEPVAVSAGTDYILNMNTKKFHYPSCSSVGQMAEKNKWAYNGNRDDVIAMGYVPCKRCNP